MIESIKYAIESLTGVESCDIIENCSLKTKGVLPPYSFMTIVKGGKKKDIANAIFNTKPAGICSVGTTIKKIKVHGLTYRIGFCHIKSKKQNEEKE